jgi:hypothetical protein
MKLQSKSGINKRRSCSENLHCGSGTAQWRFDPKKPQGPSGFIKSLVGQPEKPAFWEIAHLLLKPGPPLTRSQVT